MTELSAVPPDALRARIAANLAPVRHLPPPAVRVLWLTPFAGLLLLAAPMAFEFRDLRPLGWTWSWGASILQMVVGLGLAAAALRESVPGRSLSRSVISSLIVLTVLVVVAVTIASWRASPVPVDGRWWLIGLLCLVSSAASGLPASALACVLALRAFPTRPAVTGLVAGLAGGLMADAGWRLFCHFSEPAHVLIAHLGGILAVSLAGAALTWWLASGRTATR